MIPGDDTQSLILVVCSYGRTTVELTLLTHLYFEADGDSPLLPRDVDSDRRRGFQRFRDQQPEMFHDQLQRRTAGLHVAEHTHTQTQFQFHTDNDVFAPVFMTWQVIFSFSMYEKQFCQNNLPKFELCFQSVKYNIYIIFLCQIERHLFFIRMEKHFVRTHFLQH